MRRWRWVRTGWVPIPHLAADLEGRTEAFVLFSGHVDAGHPGAMDNGAPDTAMLEVAGLLARQGGRLRRGLRLAFRSGHSHGRSAGSAWYADHAWGELERQCVLHLNAESLGARGATDYSVLHATEDLQSVAEAVVTAGDRFRHEPALPPPPLAGLQRARELPALDPRSDACRFAVAGLIQVRNRAVHALGTAAAPTEDLLTGKEGLR